MNNILVTPTFAPDFERCKALLESSEQQLSGVSEHLLVVDRPDLELFAPLQTAKVRVLCKNELLPSMLFQIPLQKRWWLTGCSLPVRGWILQQIIKLAVAKDCGADAVVFADSDLMFIRPLDLNELWCNSRLRLFQNQRGPFMYRNRRYQNWYGFGCDALNLGNPDDQHQAYITQLATMRPDNVTKLCEALENRFQRPWYQTLLNTWDFSEYVLYGLFVGRLGQDSGHFFTQQELCHSSWFYEINKPSDVADFVSQASKHHRAVHLQSNLGLEGMALPRALGV